MAWELRRTYYYLVCFAALIMLVIGTVSAVRNVLDLVMPEEAYRPTAVDYMHRMNRGPEGEELPFTKEEMERLAEEEAHRNERAARRRAVRGLLGNLALIVIAAPLYLYHWREVRGASDGG